MDRREMLGYSIRRISKVLPGILSATTGLGGVLQFTKDDEIKGDAACFPKAKQDKPYSDQPEDDE
ncbi:MAG: hypothetical protein ACYC0V_10855 [Armatimonadota bacterium]